MTNFNDVDTSGFRDALSEAPSGPVGESNSIDDILGVIDARINANENREGWSEGDVAALAAVLSGSYLGGMIFGMMAGLSPIEQDNISKALEAQRDAISALSDALEMRDLEEIGKTLGNLSKAGVPPDIENKAREIAAEIANQIAEENYNETGILGDGATGDNIYGDGYAYDYTNGEGSSVTYDDQGRPTSSPIPPDRSGGPDASAKPVIIDLDGDGIEINIDGTVSFDVDADGFLERGAWVDEDDGFLVLDLNSDGSRGSGDGKIDQARELAFSLWGEEGDTDLQALRREFDTNNDGVLNAQDAVWSELRIWQDIDQDGVTDDGELRTLDYWGISQINLSYDDGTDYDDTSNDISIFSNTLLGSASYTKDGQVIQGGVGDVSLAYNSEGWRRVETETGFSIEFEGGQAYQFVELDGSGDTNVDLVTGWLDGALGDDRNNTLTAANHTQKVEISGGAGDDVIIGGQLDDILSGGAGVDQLDGGAGNDLIFFDESDSIVEGGTGYDTAAFVGSGNVSFDLVANGFEKIIGGAGSDTLTALNSGTNVSLSGGAGNDHLTGGNGDDSLYGNEGADALFGKSGNDRLYGGAGNDQLKGGSGDDLLSGGDGDDGLNGENGDDFILGGAGNDTFWGSYGDDDLFGDDGDDIIRGAWGDDLLSGDDGIDVLEGGIGDDTLIGGAGGDFIRDGAGDDWTIGGAGNDKFTDGEGDDVHYGNEGNDTFHVKTYSGNNVVFGGEGTDKLLLNGTSDMWSWKYVGYSQTVIIERGQGEVSETTHYGKGQYLFWSGNAVIQVQDVETVRFNGVRSETYWSHLEDQTQVEFGLAYIASYHNLIDTPSVNSWSEGYAHWKNYGQAEGKDATFNALKYLAANPGLYNTFGFDLTAATRHYIDYGKNEGRNPGTFDAEQYLRNYSDLRAQFGLDLSAATRHYIEFGRVDGKTDQAVSGAMSLSDWNDWLADQNTGIVEITLDQADASTDNSDTFFWATNNEHSDPSSEILGWYGYGETIWAGDGNDIIYADSSFSQNWLNLDIRHTTVGSADTVHGGDGSDAIFTGAGNDTANGDAGSDYIYGQNGNDILNGGGGADLLEGGNGTDTLNGDDGADLLRGGTGADTLNGGAGSDTLLGGNGNDTLNGDNGSDTLGGGEGVDILNGGAGDDLLNGDDGNDTLNGDSGFDRLFGGLGNDTLNGGGQHAPGTCPT